MGGAAVDISQMDEGAVNISLMSGAAVEISLIGRKEDISFVNGIVVGMSFTSDATADTAMGETEVCISSVGAEPEGNVPAGTAPVVISINSRAVKEVGIIIGVPVDIAAQLCRAVDIAFTCEVVMDIGCKGASILGINIINGALFGIVIFGKAAVDIAGT